MMVNDSLFHAIAGLAREAGRSIMTHFSGARASRAKADQSPVTEADLAAHAVILEGLKRFAPDIPIVSEEDEQLAGGAPGRRYWLVDPLDGTKSFVRGSGEFTVNIGLIEDGYPVMGAIHIPASDMLYYGKEGAGCFRRKGEGEEEAIRARSAPEEGVYVLKSSHHASAHVDAYLKDFRVLDANAVASSMKFCRIAEGEADLYPRFGPTMEWDTAAGQAIVEAAGGTVKCLDGKRFAYGKAQWRNPPFIVRGRS